MGDLMAFSTDASLSEPPPSATTTYHTLRDSSSLWPEDQSDNINTNSTQQSHNDLHDLLHSENVPTAKSVAENSKDDILGHLILGGGDPPKPRRPPPPKVSKKEKNKEEPLVVVEPEKAKPTFNFQDFLSKMRQPAAFDIVKAIKTFIQENSNKNMTITEATSTIRQFLDDTSLMFEGHELWKNASYEELEAAGEGLEKYLMSKMYKEFFQPRSSDDESIDQTLHQRVALLSFVQAEHLDIPPALGNHPKIERGKEELIKMNSYKGPRDKVICVMNCCKIINTLLQEVVASEEDRGADAFVPLLIYVTLKANPPNLYSNLQFIQRFRNPDKLTGEAGYYFTNMQMAVEFIRTMDASRLSIDPKLFDEELSNALESSVIQDQLLDIPENQTSQAQPPLQPNLAPIPDISAPGKDSSDTSSLVEGLVALDSADPPANAQSNSAPKISRSQSAHLQESLGQLLMAGNEPPVAKFLNCSWQDLAMGDIPLLLADYKRIAKLNDELTKTLTLNLSLG